MSLSRTVDARDARLFTAREAERAALEGLLDPDSAFRVGFVTGPAGVGKSALLRLLARSAPSYDVVSVDCRELAGDPARLRSALQRALEHPAALVLIDTYEAAGPLDAVLRDVLLPELSEGARVVIGSRVGPSPEWLRGPWGGSLLRLPLRKLTDDEARALLAARDIVDTEVVTQLVEWGRGMPLALVLGATVSTGTREELDLASLEAELLDALAGSELLGADWDVLAVAALAPCIDADLLAAVLPGVDAVASERWLRGLTFSEALGPDVTLHARVRELLADQLRRTDPALQRRLRLRIIDHLAERAMAGKVRALVHLREVLSPAEDAGVAPSLIEKIVAEAPGVGDADRVSELLQGLDPDYVAWYSTWLRSAPEHLLVIREGTEIRAVCGWVTPQNHPDLTGDPVLGPTLAAVDRLGLGEHGVIQLGIEFFGPPERRAELIAVGNNTLMTSCGLPNLRFGAMIVRPDFGADPLSFGAVPMADLGVVVGGQPLSGHVVDFGPGGVIAAWRDRAHAELGEVAPTPGALRAEDLRDALRSFHQPLVLSSHRLATGSDVTERAESVRTLLVEALPRAFGDSAADRLQRSALEFGYLDPEVGHARAIRALHVSRSTYFRRLRDATERLAAYVSAS